MKWIFVIKCTETHTLDMYDAIHGEVRKKPKLVRYIDIKFPKQSKMANGNERMSDILHRIGEEMNTESGMRAKLR